MTKHIYRGLALACAAILFAAAAFAADGPYYLHASEVNMRETPGGEITLVLDVNDKVFVVETDGNWSYVSAPVYGMKGWVWSEYIGEGRIEVPAEPAVQVSGDASSAPQYISNSKQNTIEDVNIENGSELDVAAFGLPKNTSKATGGFIPDDPATKAESAQPEPDRSIDPATIIEPEDVYAESEFHQPFEPGSNDSYTPVITVDGTDYRDTEQGISTLSTPAATNFNSDINVVSAQITTPLMLESSIYRPVGGHDLALISGSNVNVRADASLKSKVLAKATDGDKLYVVGYDDPWYFVSIPSKDVKGWVFGEYVEALPRVEISGTQVRLRRGPGTEHEIRAELNTGEVFYQFERSGDWTLVASSASGINGWVHQDYLRNTELTASRPYTVSGDEVNFRSSPAVDSDILTALPEGTEVQVLGRNEKWSYIEYSGHKGWMYSQYLNPVGRGTVVAKSPIADRLISRAKEMQGTPYVWGGESDSGVDCSGLIYKLLCDEGCDTSTLPRRASTQMAGLGVEVDKESLEPGDLVFFTTYKAGASHVGIYLGDGDFIHASSARGKVTINSMSEGYYKKRFVGARRITDNDLQSHQ